MNELVIACTTINEEKHIDRWISQFVGIQCDLVVFDAGSTDSTVPRLLSRGVKVYSYLGIDMSFAERWNTIYRSDLFSGKYILRIDADELIHSTDVLKLISIIRECSVDAIYLSRYIAFEGKLMHFGRTRTKVLRCGLSGCIRYDDVLLDESIWPVTSTQCIHSDIKIIDSPIIAPSFWLKKHLKYAELEARMVCRSLEKKKLSIRLYYMLPPYFRTLVVFILRYIFYGGFLDGKTGLKYHICHSMIYRLMVDVLITGNFTV